MKAIVKDGAAVQLRDAPAPAIQSDHDVLIRVHMAALCRTDLYVADGIIPTRDPLVVGHEFAGTVAAMGVSVEGLARDDAVAVMPVLPCGECRDCRRGRSDLCQTTRMLGLDVDGAFAEYVRVPRTAVHRLHPALGFREGAYSEPVAASLAVLKTGIAPEQKGLVYGGNRIAELTLMILRAKGFNDVDMAEPMGAEVLERRGLYDFVIETVASTRAMADILEMVRPGGRIVLKSRKHEPVGLSVNRAVMKEVTFSAVNYGNFAEAVALMAEGGLEVAALFGETYPVDRWADMFAAGRRAEARKLFIDLG